MSDKNWNNAELAPIVLLKGTESVFSSRAIKRLKKLLLANNPEAEIINIDPKLYKKGDLYLYISPSLFSTEKLILIEQLQTGTDELFVDLLEYVNNMQNDIYFILQYTSGTKGKKFLDTIKKKSMPIIKCDPLKYPKEKFDFIQNEVKIAGRKISSQANKALVDALGADFENLVSATNQLICDVEGEITLEDVNKYYAGRLDISQFAIADEIAKGNVQKALLLLRHALLNGLQPVLINAAIAGKIRSIIKVNGMRMKNMTPKDIAMAPWQVDKLSHIARLWDEKAMSKAINIVAELDYQVKGGSKNVHYALEKAVIQLCRLI